MPTTGIEIVTKGLQGTSLGQANFSKSPVAVEYAKYNSLASPDHIRLLRILPGDREPLVVSLEEVEIEKAAYECLSYTWDGPKYSDTGDEWTTNHKVIICNKVILNIRQNLYDVLKHMRELSMLGPIWIDALCINQENKQERQQQVGLMSRIYKGANRVIVWLGKHDEYTAPALEYLKRSKATPAGVYDDSGFDTKAYHEANFTDEEFDSIFCFLAHRRWFSRTWTIQETFLALDLIFLCGKYQATLENIYAGSSALRYRNARTVFNFDYQEISDQAEWAVNLFEIANSRHQWQQDDTELRCIGINALNFSKCQATDLKDKVFGLIGISQCRNDDLDDEIVADYNMSIEEVFIKSAKFALLACINLDALSRTQPEERKEVEDLPSWVPDLSVEGVDFFESEESYMSACTHQELYTLDFEGNVMILAASPFDRIVSVGESFDEIQYFGTLVQFLTVFLDIGETYEHTKENMLVAMRRTLIADTLDLDSQDEVAIMKKEYDMQAALDQWLFRLVCYCLRADPEGSDSDTESGSESDSESDSGSGSESGSESRSESGSGSNDEWSAEEENCGNEFKGLGSEATTAVEDLPAKAAKAATSEQSQSEKSTEPVTDIAMEAPTESEEIPMEAKIETSESSSASVKTESTTPSHALRRAAAASRKVVREALLDTFLSDPPGTLHASMSILGFPDPATYSLLEPAILRGAASCQHKTTDFPVDELFSHMWCAMDPYASSWFYTMRSKVPFRTEKGFVGIGTALEVGDDIFWIEGAASMYVLRPREDKEDWDLSIPHEEKNEILWPTTPVTGRGMAEMMDVPLVSPVDPETAQTHEPLSDENAKNSNSEEATPTGKDAPPTIPGSPISRPLKEVELKEVARPEIASNEEDDDDDDEWEDESDEDDDDEESGSEYGSSEDSYEEGGDYTLGGEVYVHGLMYGEAFKDEKGDDIVFQKVRVY